MIPRTRTVTLYVTAGSPPNVAVSFRFTVPLNRYSLVWGQTWPITKFWQTRSEKDWLGPHGTIQAWLSMTAATVGSTAPPVPPAPPVPAPPAPPAPPVF